MLLTSKQLGRLPQPGGGGGRWRQALWPSSMRSGLCRRSKTHRSRLASHSQSRTSKFRDRLTNSPRLAAAGVGDAAHTQGAAAMKGKAAKSHLPLLAAAAAAAAAPGAAAALPALFPHSTSFMPTHRPASPCHAVVSTLQPDTSCREIGRLAVWSVTSAKPGNGVELLRDGREDTYWQSDGSQPHLINVQFQKKASWAAVGSGAVGLGDGCLAGLPRGGQEGSRGSNAMVARADGEVGGAARVGRRQADVWMPAAKLQAAHHSTCMQHSNSHHIFSTASRRTGLLPLLLFAHTPCALHFAGCPCRCT